ncbi:hypothetical protein SELMODRAFT_414794 [Selaginella moellendorffii]|uniref:Uncharacterized protein n=1 Tax=Selaginella moellendorffii TaxID=88036 RepID=D8RUM8_SELML|nr:hypothetical protein SELMODRAFT_414794 [Selaginella moellendorffii]
MRTANLNCLNCGNSLLFKLAKSSRRREPQKSALYSEKITQTRDLVAALFLQSFGGMTHAVDNRAQISPGRERNLDRGGNEEARRRRGGWQFFFLLEIGFRASCHGGTARLEDRSTLEVVNHVFAGSDPEEKQRIVEVLHCVGVRFGRDIARPLDEPEEVRKVLGRPLSSSIAKPLIAHKLLNQLSPGKQCVRALDLDRKEDRQSKITGLVIRQMFKGVTVPKHIYKPLLLPLIDGVDQTFDNSDDAYDAYEAMVEKMKQRLGTAVTFDKVDVKRPDEPCDNDSEVFRFCSQEAKLLWVMRAGSENTACVGALMYDYGPGFQLRSFAIGVVLIQDFIWVFKFIPESFDPVACLYVLLREGGLKMLTKLMCAQPGLLGVL